MDRELGRVTLRYVVKDLTDRPEAEPTEADVGDSAARIREAGRADADAEGCEKTLSLALS
jgi:hypothetical protein